MSNIPNFSQQRPDWQAIFGNDHPLKVEIGPGKGQFLITRAQQESEVNFVAIEIRRKRVEKIESKIARAELGNVRVIFGNGKQLLPTLFAPTSVATFYVHFPDPWPKTRHARRRLLDDNMIAVLHQMLVPDGKIYVTTDVESYFQTVSRLFCEHRGFDIMYQKSGDYDAPNHRSIHEWKFKLRGRTIYYLCFGKKAS